MVEGPVPVMVTEYPTVVVSLVVVIVTVALAGGVTVVGLTVQTGVDVVVCVDNTSQVRSTVPLKPLTVPIVMFEDDVPPGGTASGENGSACRVKSCADADTLKTAITRHKRDPAARAARVAGPNFELNLDKLNFDELNFDSSDCNDLDFDMSRFEFK